MPQETLDQRMESGRNKEANWHSQPDPTEWFFWTLLVCHVLVWTILPASTQPNVPQETLLLLSSGQTPAWGYFEHPPLAAWLVSAACAISHPSVWPAYFLTQICTVVCLWAAWKLSREFLHPWTALCAAIVLEGCYFFTLTSPTLTTLHVSRAFWAMGVLSCYWALTRERRRYWVATGLCLGFGVLSSYITVAFVASLFVFLVLNERARRCWDSSWPIFGSGIMALVALPHFLWLASHRFDPLWAHLESSNPANHLMFPLQFGFSQVVAVIPVIILLTPLIAYFSLEENSENCDDDREFARRYLLMVTLLPPCLMGAVSLVMGLHLDWLSGTPLWTFVGVLFLLWSRLEETREAWRAVVLRSVTLSGAFAAALIAMNIMLPEARQQASSIHFPGKSLSQTVEKVWSDWYPETKLPIIAGPAHLAQNVGWYGKSRPSQFIDLSPEKSVGINSAVFIQKGGLIVWEEENPYTADQIATFGNVLVLEPTELPWQTKAGIPPLRIGMALVHPQQVETAHEDEHTKGSLKLVANQ